MDLFLFLFWDIEILFVFTYLFLSLLKSRPLTFLQFDTKCDNSLFLILFPNCRTLLGPQNLGGAALTPKISFTLRTFFLSEGHIVVLVYELQNGQVTKSEGGISLF